jgi:hypothetical protein
MYAQTSYGMPVVKETFFILIDKLSTFSLPPHFYRQEKEDDFPSFFHYTAVHFFRLLSTATQQ